MTSVPGFKVSLDPLHALLPTHNGLFKFTSGAKSADLLAGSMAAESLRSTYLYTTIGGT